MKVVGNLARLLLRRTEPSIKMLPLYLCHFYAGNLKTPQVWRADAENSLRTLKPE